MTSSSSLASTDGRFDVMAAACPTRQVMSRIGDKWTLLTLFALRDRTLRFSELRREVEGVSQKMLTQTLRGLERDGLVSRRVHATIPPKVEYSVTPLGASLEQVIASLRAWAYGHMDEISDARRAYDSRNGDGVPERDE